MADARDTLELAKEEEDEDLYNSVSGDLISLEKLVAGLEFQRMFSGPMDGQNAFVDIQSGSGGTEAQDWAEMLLRMYLALG